MLLWTLGDSWTDPGDATHAFDPPGVLGWAEQLAPRYGLGLVNGACGGAGYSTRGRANASIPMQPGWWPCPAADLAVVFGSVNDYLTGRTPEQVTAGATATYAAIRRQAPAARLLVLGPQWWAAPIPDGMPQLADAVAAAACDAGATFVDTLRWFQGRPELLGASNHPTADGYAYLADRVADLIRDARLLDAVPSGCPQDPCPPALPAPWTAPLTFVEQPPATLPPG